MSWGEDKMKVFKERFLAVLEDEEVREKLRVALNADGKIPVAVPVAKENEPRWINWEQKKEEAVEQVRQSYKEALERANRQLTKLQVDCAGISRERDQLSEQCRKLQNQLNKVCAEQQRDRDEYKRSYQQIRHEAEEKQEKYEVLREKQEQQVSELQKKLVEAQAVSAPFAEALRIYEQVQSLSPAVKKRVQSYFKSQTPVSFLVCAGQENNLSSLWDIAKEENANCSVEDKSILLTLLTYSIEQVNDSYDTPRYALRSDQVGERFDNRFHIRSPDSSLYSGPIKEVILPGIDQLNTGKVVRQSVVRV